MFSTLFKILPTILLVLVPTIIIILLVKCWVEKIHIDFKSLKNKGFKADDNPFGVYVYDAPQGNGKTYNMANYIYKNQECKIFANMDLDYIDYCRYSGFDGLIDIKNYIDSIDYKTGKDKDKQIVILFDELFTELMRGSKLNEEVLDFLFQMRKRKIIFITSAQYWRQIPKDFRDFVRFEVQCKKMNIFGTTFFIKKFGDAENMIYDDLQQDFVCPLIDTYIEKSNIEVANLYDTYQIVGK